EGSRRTTVQPQGHSANDPLHDALVTAETLLAEATAEWEEAIKLAAANTRERIATIDEVIKGATVRLQEFDTAFHETERRIMEEIPDAKIDEFLTIESEIVKLRPLRMAQQENEAFLAVLETERLNLLDRLLAVKRSRYQLRKLKADEISE